MGIRRNDSDPAGWHIAFGGARPLLVAVAALGAAGFFISVYFLVGYIHYRHIAEHERLAADRAARTNIDLQQALEDLQDKLARAKGEIDEASNTAAVGNIVSVTKYMEPAESVDLAPAQQEPSLWVALNESLIETRLQQAWVRVNLDETRQKLQNLSAEYADIVSERDGLQQQLGQLKQVLSLLKPRQALPFQRGRDQHDGASGSSLKEAHGTAVPNRRPTRLGDKSWSKLNDSIRQSSP
jgi:hypothetical protein